LDRPHHGSASDRRAVRKDFINQALNNIPWYKLSERGAARQDAVQRAEDALQEEERQRAKAQSDEQIRVSEKATSRHLGE
jgi:transposase